MCVRVYVSVCVRNHICIYTDHIYICIPTTYADNDDGVMMMMWMMMRVMLMIVVMTTVVMTLMILKGGDSVYS